MSRMRWSLAASAACVLFMASHAPEVRAEVNAGALVGTPVDESVAVTSQDGLALPPTLGKVGLAARVSSVERDKLGNYSKALDALPTGGPPALRGAREVAIYAQISPSVVLILNGDTLGSGTLLDASGLIVTNWHVVARASEVGVIFKPSTEGAQLTKAQVVQGRVIRTDQIADLALVQVPFVPAQAHPARLAATDLQVGDDVHAIGHPTGEAWTYTRGIVSQIRRNYRWTTEEHLQHHADVIQTQTPINPGNSGGPLLNNDGDIVGVNSFKGEGEGLNFAVSSHAVNTIINATGSRTALAVPGVENTRASAKCEPKFVKKWRMTDPPGFAASYDANCTGVADMIIELPDDQSKPGLVLLDSKHKGKVDIVLVEQNRDGYPEYALYDTTGSGKPDLIGYFHNHEAEPYRVEKYSP
jgi:S1-C subfamily serine protease